MLIIDAHLDLAWNALDWNRDLRLPVDELRRREADVPGKGRGCNTVSFPELRRGKVGLFIATLLARLHRPGAMAAPWYEDWLALSELAPTLGTWTTLSRYQRDGLVGELERPRGPGSGDRVPGSGLRNPREAQSRDFGHQPGRAAVLLRRLDRPADRRRRGEVVALQGDATGEGARVEQE